MFFLFLPFFVFLNPTSIPHRSRESHPWLREAVPYFDKAIELNPKNARAYGDRGIAWFLLWKHADAQLDFAKCYELEPA
jgi:tetratricopeptide (TPR) repeat protein